MSEGKKIIGVDYGFADTGALTITLPDGTQDITWKGDGCYELIMTQQTELEALRSGIPPTNREQEELLSSLNGYANRRMAKRSYPQDLATSALMEIIYRGFDIEALQAKIDSLMLEYCPDEMSKEQMDNWGKHQVPVSKEVDAAIQRSLGIPPKHRPGDSK